MSSLTHWRRHARRHGRDVMPSGGKGWAFAALAFAGGACLYSRLANGSWNPLVMSSSLKSVLTGPPPPAPLPPPSPSGPQPIPGAAATDFTNLPPGSKVFVNMGFDVDGHPVAGMSMASTMIGIVRSSSVPALIQASIPLEPSGTAILVGPTGPRPVRMYSGDVLDLATMAAVGSARFTNLDILQRL
jgi:hypothetical protein